MDLLHPEIRYRREDVKRVGDRLSVWRICLPNVHPCARLPALPPWNRERNIQGASCRKYFGSLSSFYGCWRLGCGLRLPIGFEDDPCETPSFQRIVKRRCDSSSPTKRQRTPI